jgi:hypothetical protein
MTAMIGSADCPPDRLAATRAGLHRVAEHVLAAARYAATGEIGLVPSPGGFRTPPFTADGRFLAVDGGELVVGGAAGTRRITSPGDDQTGDPYVYVGPHAGPPPGDPAFWNAAFGAARTFRQIGTVAEAAAFFRDGRARARAR